MGRCVYTKAKCCICDRGPYTLKGLYVHLRSVHKCTDDYVETVQIAIKKAKNQGQKELECPVCKKIAHKNPNATPGVKKPTLWIKCPGCDEAFNSHLEMAEHCGREHNDGSTDFSILRISFSSWADFEVWRDQKQVETSSRLVKRSVRDCLNWTSSMYTCKKSSTSKDVPKERKRSYKKRTIDNGKNCPCFARASIFFFLLVRLYKDGRVDVVACFGHYGHEPRTNVVVRPVEGAELKLPALCPDLLSHETATPQESQNLFGSDLQQWEPTLEDEPLDMDFTEPQSVNFTQPHDVVDSVQPREVDFTIDQEDTIPREKAEESYKNFESNITRVRELLRTFIEGEQYELVNEWCNLFGSLTQLVASQVTQRSCVAQPSSQVSSGSIPTVKAQIGALEDIDNLYQRA
ncbi:zinc finger, C2H2 type [Ancylostoma caninum]|uniref:Zinc finger, C2H2 type n=1 Tax=Ancylostoma caninum TaxID=29170 RepID=A0A368HBJ2_ANCCA|nr:zinc finger, C2H2 type [Ancylostoma caninum]